MPAHVAGQVQGGHTTHQAGAVVDGTLMGARPEQRPRPHGVTTRPAGCQRHGGCTGIGRPRQRPHGQQAAAQHQHQQPGGTTGHQSYQRAVQPCGEQALGEGEEGSGMRTNRRVSQYAG